MNTRDTKGKMRRGFGMALVLGFSLARADHIQTIMIDGAFDDWAAVPSYSDPVGGPGVLHDGIPDTHDTDHGEPNEVPSYRSHPDIDLIEFKVAHDRENLYAYFRATGQIGRTAKTTTQHGRYYVIVTIDVDNDDVTGYGVHEGGYFPTSYGYDMNMEVEYYDGAFNTGHYLNHGAQSEEEYDAAEIDQKAGIVRVSPGSYGWYTQWVWFDQPTAGVYPLPAPDNFASITFVRDRGPVYQGILRIALSADRRQAEMVAPFRGFMRYPNGQPIMALGKTIDLSFSLEASGELAPGGDWASDTGDPVVGYYLSPFTDPGLQISRAGTDGNVVLSWSEGAIGMRLQQTPSLVDPVWEFVDDSETTNQMELAAGNDSALYRLVEP